MKGELTAMGQPPNILTVRGPRNTEKELSTVKKTLEPVSNFQGHIAIPRAAVMKAPL